MTATPPIPEPDFLSGSFLMGSVGAPFAIGVAVGYFIKKILRIALFISGGLLVLIFMSQQYGWFSISDESLQGATLEVTRHGQAVGNFLVERLSAFTSKGVSAVTGFMLGLKLG